MLWVAYYKRRAVVDFLKKIIFFCHTKKKGMLHTKLKQTNQKLPFSTGAEFNYDSLCRKLQRWVEGGHHVVVKCFFVNFRSCVLFFPPPSHFLHCPLYLTLTGVMGASPRGRCATTATATSGCQDYGATGTIKWVGPGQEGLAFSEGNGQFEFPSCTVPD